MTEQNTNPSSHPQTTPQKRKWLKLLGFSFLGLLGVFLLLILCLPLYSPLFKGYLSGPLAKLTGRTTTVGTLSLNLLTSRLFLQDLIIKEPNGKDDFLHLQKVDVDFSIWPLLTGKLEVPKAEIAGLQLKVRIDQNGRPGFQDILDRFKRMAPPKPPHQAPPPKQPLPDGQGPLKQLPAVTAHVLIKDINFQFENLQTQQQLLLKNFSLDCKVAGLDNITYHSKWDNLDFASTRDQRRAGLLYNLDGQLSLRTNNGWPAIQLKGRLAFPQAYAKGFGKQDLENAQVSLDHDIALDMAKGTLQVQNLAFQSDYFSLKVSGLQLTDLQKMMKPPAAPPAPGLSWRQRLATLLQGLSPQQWHGQVQLRCDLGKLKRDFGQAIAQLSQGQLSDFGGQCRLDLSLAGQPQARLQFKEKFQIDNFFLAGQLPAPPSQARKPYNITLQQILQTLDANFDCQNANLGMQQRIHILVPRSHGAAATLFKMTRDIQGEHLVGAQPLRISKWEDHLHFDLGVLCHLIKDLLPPQTSFKGKIVNNEKIQGQMDQGFREQGDTEILLALSSPRAPGLAPLHIVGAREVYCQLDPAGGLQQVDFRKMYLNSKDNDILKFKVSGALNLPARQVKNLRLDLFSNLHHLQKYLAVFVTGLQLKGKIHHNTAISGNEQAIKISGGGGIEQLYCALPGKAGQLQKITLPRLAWRNDMTIKLRQHQPQAVVFPNTPQAYCGLQHPALAVRLCGAIKGIELQPLNFRLHDLQVQVYGDLAKLPPFVYQQLQQKGIKLQTQGTYRNTLALSGKLNDLQLQNTLRYAGRIEMTMSKGNSKSHLLLDEQMHGDLALQIKGLAAFAQHDPEASLQIAFLPNAQKRPTFQILHKQQPVLHVQLGGMITRKGPQLNIKGLHLTAQLYGRGLQQAIPLPEQRAQLKRTLSLQGQLNCNVVLDASMEPRQKNMGLRLDLDMTPLVVRFKNQQGQLLVNKGAQVPCFYKTQVQLESNAEHQKLVVAPLQLRFASLGFKTGLQIKDKVLSGPHGQPSVVIEIPATKLDSLQPVLPILKQIGLTGATLEFKLYDLGGNLATKDMHGKLHCLVMIPTFSLVKLQKALGKKSRPQTSKPAPRPAAPAKAKPAPAPPADAPIKTLDPQTREMLKHFGLDIRLQAGQIELDSQNEIRDLDMRATFNQEKPDNHFLTLVKAQVNPQKTNAGKLSIKIQGDLSQPNPPFEVNYDIIEMPYLVDLYAPLTASIKERIPFPFLQKIKISDPAKITFYLQGTNKWRGLDPRAIKKSLVSTRQNKLKLPKGEFDLGFKLNKFADLKAVQGALQAKLKPLNSQLQTMQGRQGQLKSKLRTLQRAHRIIQQRITEIEQKRQTFISIIEKLKPLAAWNPITRQKLNKAEAELKRYDQQLAQYKSRRASKLKALQQMQAQMAKLQKKMDSLQAKIDKMQKKAQSSINLPNPFKFNFEDFTLCFTFENPNPWPGLGGLLGLQKHPTSKVQYLKFEFAPANPNLPTITGWSDLDGHFKFNFIPSPHMMKQLGGKAPVLSSLLRNHKGVSWSSQGFEPNPLK